MLLDACLENLFLGVDSLAMELLEQGGVSGPAVDAVELAWKLGLQVSLAGNPSQRGEFVRSRVVAAHEGILAGPSGKLGGKLHSSATSSHPKSSQTLGNFRGIIKVRPEERSERVHWAVAHEIGEAYSAELTHRVGLHFSEVSPELREALCNQFAGRLLAPSTWLRNCGPACDWDLAELKRIFCTASNELIARRCMDECPEAVYTVCDQGKISWRKSGRARRTIPWFSGERSVWQTAHVDGQHVDVDCGHWRVRVWPLHEECWQREILRTESNSPWHADVEASPPLSFA